MKLTTCLGLFLLLTTLGCGGYDGPKALSTRVPLSTVSQESETTEVTSTATVATVETATPLPPTPTPLPTVTNPVTSPDQLLNGVNFLVYGNDSEFEEIALRTLDYLLGLGVNAISLVWPIYQDHMTATQVKGGKDTLSDDNIAFFIEEAKARGFWVMVRPLMDEGSLVNDPNWDAQAYGAPWRGNIQPSDLTAWFSSYQGLTDHYLAIAETSGADAFSLGAEFNSLEEHTDQWRALIAASRSVFSGELTYASNWTVSDRVQFWQDLDFISVDPYSELKVAVGAPVEDLVVAWQERLDEILIRAYVLDMPVVFAEVGVASQVGANLRPWIGDHGTPVDLEEQRRYYEAACRVAYGRVRGVFWWAESTNPPADPLQDRSFDFHGKPSEEEIRECYSP